MMRRAKIATVVFVVLAGLAQARTITVGPGPGYDFNSIQPAIDDSNDGDTIIVQPGLYREMVKFNGKNITLRSTNPANSNVVASTIIDYGVGFAGTEEPNCMLKGFKINGWVSGGQNHTQATISHCLFGGSANPDGTAISGCDGTISNCVIVDNRPSGDAIGPVIRGCHGLIKNCTIAHNASGISILEGGTTTIENCIIYHGGGVGVNSGATVNILYSDVEGGLEGIFLMDEDSTLNWGPGNMDADPCFVRVGDWFGELNGDYHLLPDSPCIDAGDPNYIAEPNETDLDGKPRIIGGRIDMGAYEYTPPIPAEVRIVPRTLNLASKGKWITSLFWLPEDYDVADIDPNSVLLEDEIEPQRFRVNEHRQVATARFNAEELRGILNIGDVELTISGRLTNVTAFEATDIIKVIDKRAGKSAVGRTIYVDDDGPADFNTIQAAIDDSNDGDTIIVQPGLYIEFVKFGGKNITLTSTNPSDFNVVASTVISSVGFLGTEEPDCMLAGFNINAIYGAEYDIDPKDRNHNNATISYCLFSSNVTYNCTVISGCDGTISNCVVVDNRPGSHIIGPAAISGCHGLIKNCTIAHNRFTPGIWVMQGYTTTVENCIIYHNAGGIWAEGTVNILYSDVQGIYGGGDVNWGPGNINADPCFVRVQDPFGRFEGDYHLKSQAGRWEPSSQTWVLDNVTSPCIDAGNPHHPIGLEPFPNGGRVNMGAYGGTQEASKSYFGEPVCRVIYVDADVNGVNDGSSWANAYNYLQDALAAASSGDEIWVAEGTYKADSNSVDPNGSGDRTATFQLKNGVTIKGGYAGFGQPDSNVRDMDKYETILSGDLNGDDSVAADPADLLDEPTRAENSYHVVTGSGTDANAILDGFTITGGNANEDYPSPYACGGGMYNELGNPRLFNCTIKYNSTKSVGAGVFNSESRPIFTGCIFSRNSSQWSGGGMYNTSGSTPIVTNCIFSGNWSGYMGGGMAIGPKSAPIMTNCTFSGNSASKDYGGIYRAIIPPISGHSASRNGLNTKLIGANSTSAGRILTNCILWANSDRGGMDESAQINSAVILYYCCIQGWTGALGGPGNIGDDPLFADPNNGDYHLRSQAGRWDANEGRWTTDDVTSPCIDAGDPMSPIGLEPFPNGGRVNIGAYGATAEASKSYFGEPVCETVVAGDINGDCRVNFKDFAFIALHWLRDETQ